jgi:hypothetical protein
MKRLLLATALTAALITATTTVSIAADPGPAPASTSKPNEKAPPPTPKPGEEVSEEFFNYIHSETAFRCQQAVKRLVKYDIRSPGIMWGTNSGDSLMFLLSMSRWSKYVASDNTIFLRGDKAEAQNAFGNWIRANYSCTIDLASKAVKDATLNEGRLPNLLEHQ